MASSAEQASCQVEQKDVLNTGQQSSDLVESQRPESDLVKDAIELHKLLSNFHHEVSVEALRSNLKHRRGSDSLKDSLEQLTLNRDTAIVDILCSLTNKQRQKLASIYKTQFDDDLVTALNSKFTGNFCELLLALMEEPARFDARQLHHAIFKTSSLTGLSKKDSTLIEILCTRSNQEIRKIKREYRSIFGSYLEHDLTKTTWHHLMHLFMWLVSASREESTTVDHKVAQEDARMLRGADHEEFGRESALFSVILSLQNHEQLRALFAEYFKLSNVDLEKVVENEFDGDYQDALLVLISSVNNTLPIYFAKRLHHAMHGIAKHDMSLIRMIVSRSEIDLAEIHREYEQLHKKSLEDHIEKYCSGSFKDGLIGLLDPQ